MYEYRITKYIGAYAAALGGVDIIVFTGGVGENQTITREAVCKPLAFMGVEIDPEINKQIHGTECVISTPASKVKVVVIPTDEEYMIASIQKPFCPAKCNKTLYILRKRRTHCTPFLFSLFKINLGVLIEKWVLHHYFHYLNNRQIT